MEKAYDTAWKHGILLDLYKTDLRGRLPMFVRDFFLSGHYFKVRVGNIYSDPYTQEEGVPQGSILSVTLFGLKINSIIFCLLPDIKCSLYVGDLAIYYSSNHKHYVCSFLSNTKTSFRSTTLPKWHTNYNNW